MEDFLRIVLLVILYFLTLALTLGAFLVYRKISSFSDVEIAVSSVIAGILACAIMAHLEEE